MAFLDDMESGAASSVTANQSAIATATTNLASAQTSLNSAVAALNDAVATSGHDVQAWRRRVDAARAGRLTQELLDAHDTLSASIAGETSPTALAALKQQRRDMERDIAGGPISVVN